MRIRVSRCSKGAEDGDYGEILIGRWIRGLEMKKCRAANCFVYAVNSKVQVTVHSSLKKNLPRSIKTPDNKTRSRL